MWLFLMIFLWFFSIFFPSYYISELLISFLPYMLIISFWWLLLTIILLRNKKFRKVKNWKYAQILPLFILLLWLLFFLTSRQYNGFYTWEWFEDQNIIETWLQNIENNWMNILYSNILYTNDDYTWLQDMIDQYSPDMIFMVEFTDEHNKYFKSKLKKDYPYSARTNWSQKYFGGVVFSKNPIVNLTHEVDQWAWRYTYFKTNHNGLNYYIYLIHTSSPITYRHFVMRNKQFNIISKDYLAHQKVRWEDDRVIMIWDFNVSPWSKYYKDFSYSLSWLQNITTKFSHLFTRNISYLPFIQSHIDHIFTSQDVEVWNIQIVDTPGSDHRWFYIENIR